MPVRDLCCQKIRHPFFWRYWGTLVDSGFWLEIFSKVRYLATEQTDGRFLAPARWRWFWTLLRARSVFQRPLHQLPKMLCPGHCCLAYGQAVLCNWYCIHRRWCTEAAWGAPAWSCGLQANCWSLSHFKSVRWPGKQVGQREVSSEYIYKNGDLRLLSTAIITISYWNIFLFTLFRRDLILVIMVQADLSYASTLRLKYSVTLLPFRTKTSNRTWVHANTSRMQASLSASVTSVLERSLWKLLTQAEGEQSYGVHELGTTHLDDSILFASSFDYCNFLVMTESSYL